MCCACDRAWDCGFVGGVAVEVVGVETVRFDIGLFLFGLGLAKGCEDAGVYGWELLVGVTGAGGNGGGPDAGLSAPSSRPCPTEHEAYVEGQVVDVSGAVRTTPSSPTSSAC